MRRQLRFVALPIVLGAALLVALLWLTQAQPSNAAPSEAISINPVYQTANTTIISGASLGAAVDLLGGRLVAVAMPPAWTAASLTLQASVDGLNYYNVYDDGGTEVLIVGAANRHIVFDALNNVEGVRWVKVRSGTAAAAVNQGGTRTITLTVRP